MVQVVGQALRGLADGVDVHTVGTQPQLPAKATRAESEVTVERILTYVGVNFLKFGSTRLVKAVEPVLITGSRRIAS